MTWLGDLNGHFNEMSRLADSRKADSDLIGLMGDETTEASISCPNKRHPGTELGSILYPLASISNRLAVKLVSETFQQHAFLESNGPCRRGAGRPTIL